jgi:hypothetical protein
MKQLVKMAALLMTMCPLTAQDPGIIGPPLPGKQAVITHFQAMDRVTVTFPSGKTMASVIIEVGEIGTFNMPDGTSRMSRAYVVVLTMNGESGAYIMPEFAMVSWVDPKEEK